MIQIGKLIMLQKSTLENKSLEAFMGKDFALSADLPSLVMLVAQKVLVKIPNTRTTIKDKENSNPQPSALKIKVSNNV